MMFYSTSLSSTLYISNKRYFSSSSSQSLDSTRIQCKDSNNSQKFEISNKYPFNPIYLIEKESTSSGRKPRINRSSGLISKQRINS